MNQSRLPFRWFFGKNSLIKQGESRLAIVGLFLMGGLSAGQAADWYLHADQGTDWNTLADWWSTPEGSSGTHPTSISSADNFYSNGCVTRSPIPAPATFGGASLTLKGGTIAVKTTSTTQPTTIGNLISYGGNIGNWTGGIQIVNITNLSNYANTTLASGGSTRGMNLTIGTLKGVGDLSLVGNGTLLITINNANSFYGTMYADGTTAVSFQNPFVSGGTLVVPSGVVMTLNATVTFSGLTVNGVDRTPGTYTAASLGFNGTGSIIVKQPLAWHLHAGQPVSNSWNTVADWWSAPVGGTVSSAIDSNDDYYTNNFLLRTPIGSFNSTFGGASLTINGGSVLFKNLGAWIAEIPYVNAQGGAISHGTSGTINLAVTQFHVGASTNLDTNASNRGFNLSVNNLKGPGNLTLLGHGGGPLILNVENAKSYTGTLTMSASSTGAITFQKPFFSAGSLVVNTGNSVVVNKPVTFAGLTVGGVPKAAGVYTPASLGFTGTGSVKVQPRPPKMFGVNWSGMEGQTTIVPTDGSFAYYQSKGLTLIRVPFKWERIQPALNGPLDPTQLGYLDTVLTRAANHNIKIILDMHNYGKYGSNVIGSTAVPYAAYQDVWTKLATHFAASPNAGSIYAYDIMNEPNGSTIDWPTSAQYGINGVRAGDSERFIMVEGRAYSSAKDWPRVNAGLININDPQKKIIFSAHCYFAKANNDGYLSYDAEGAYPNKGVELIAPFVEWCKSNQVHGHVGEYGVPDTDPRWNVVLQNFLQYLSDNDISGTYWSGGAVSVNYSLRCEPTSNNTVDEPQMAVLQLFHQ